MRAYIGLGSNLDSPQQQVLSAIAEITALDGVQAVEASSLYRSLPMGPQDQPDYINAVIAVDTSMDPHALLDALQRLEQDHGRKRLRHWGERTLDLDIIVYDDLILTDERLHIPHPGLAERAFVLYPLAEVAPSLQVPTFGPVSELLTRCDATGLVRLEKDA
jgi:2-amino-4-hydroxy-6-hydroxymethyldihydropteridine diphosphokinase